MARSMHGGAVLRKVKDVLVVGGAKKSSHPSLPNSIPSSSPFLLPPPTSMLSPPCRHLHLASSRLCYRASVNALSLHSSPLLPSPPLSLPSSTPTLHLSTSPLTLKIWSKVEGEDSKKSKKKDHASPLVTVIDTEERVSKMGLDQAERLARRRDLKLVKVEDPSETKGSKDVYRLLTGKQYFEEQVKSKKAEKKSSTHHKDEKNLAIGGNITQHDLEFKLHNITKWLSKGHHVKVTITSKKSSKEDMERVFSTIEEEVKKAKARITQRHEKQDDIRFHIAAPKVKDDHPNEHTTDDESKSDEAK